MKKLIPFILLILLFAAGCDLAGINLTTTSQSAAINSFGTSPPTISAGESSTLSWSVSGATTVNIDQGIGNVALSGSRVVMPGSTTVYTLTATSPSGMSVTATAQVIVSGTTPPTPTPTPTPTPSGLPVINYFTASPSNISPGDSSYLSWDVDNATLVNIDHGIGLVISTGAKVVFPAMSTSYTLTATNSVGSSSKTTTVLVSGEPASTSFAVTSVTASVNPPFFSGTCPTTFNSYTLITANGPGTVTYRWEDSEGGIKSTESLYFSGAGSQSVSTTWPVGLSGTVWVRLHILSPNETLSNQASFTLICASAPATGWTGTWDTNWGTMVLSQSGNQVSGTYTWDNGHISGTVAGNVFSGTWSESPSYSPPNDAGDVQLTLSADGQTISGQWRYDSSGSWYGWTGTRIP
jgi:hypothetical protein